MCMHLIPDSAALCCNNHLHSSVKASTTFWSMTVWICDHSATRSLVRSGLLWCLGCSLPFSSSWRCLEGLSSATWLFSLIHVFLHLTLCTMARSCRNLRGRGLAVETCVVVMFRCPHIFVLWSSIISRFSVAASFLLQKSGICVILAGFNWKQPYQPSESKH